MQGGGAARNAKKRYFAVKSETNFPKWDIIKQDSFEPVRHAKGENRMSGLLCFLLGLAVGTVFGVLVMACLQAGRQSDEDARRLHRKT